MATQKKSNNLMLCLLLVAIMVMEVASAAQIKETKMTVYVQSIFKGPDSNVIPVAGLANASFVQFGTVFVNDYLITEKPENTSKTVGRLQGVNTIVSLDGYNSLPILSMVFSNEEYNGSSLEIQGISKQFDKVREIPIVSGTGLFRNARGHITLETFFVDQTSVYSTIQCNVFAQHY